jgi:cysteinyl-tRNA synthetase
LIVEIQISFFLFIGDRLDIRTSDIDRKSPHHDNEIALFEAHCESNSSESTTIKE